MLYETIAFPDNAPLQCSIVEVEEYPFHMHDDVCLLYTSTLPQTPGTVRLFDKARLLRMKGDAILLNGGRGFEAA